MAPTPTTSPADETARAGRGERWVGIDHVGQVIDPRHGGEAHGPTGENEEEALHALLQAASEALRVEDRALVRMEGELGLDVSEVAGVLGISIDAAHQRVFETRRRLARAVRALLLWDAGDTACPRLGVALHAAGVARFGSGAERIIAVHVTTCDECVRTEDRLLAGAA